MPVCVAAVEKAAAKTWLRLFQRILVIDWWSYRSSPGKGGRTDEV
jgi:hypothetical protein